MRISVRKKEKIYIQQSASANEISENGKKTDKAKIVQLQIVNACYYKY